MKVLPNAIKANPEIATPVKGIKGWKVQGNQGLVVFFEIEQGVNLPVHSHCFQWGIVVDGAFELEIEGDRRTYRTGDNYMIPEGANHSARFLEKTVVIDFFSDPTRY